MERLPHTGTPPPLESAASTAISMVALADLKIDTRLQLRAAPHDDEHLKNLEEAARSGRLIATPVTVFTDTEGVNWLADGHARVEASRKAGVTTIPALVRSGTYRDAFRFALSANAGHGARRTNKDKHKAVAAALTDAEYARLTDAVVADLCAVSDRFVAHVRAELAPVTGPTVPTRRKGRDGKSYPARKALRSTARTNGSELAPRDVDSSCVCDAPVAKGVSAVAMPEEVPSPAAPPSQNGLVATSTGPLDENTADVVLAPKGDGVARGSIDINKLAAALVKPIDAIRANAKYWRQRIRQVRRRLDTVAVGSLKGKIADADLRLLAEVRDDIVSILRAAGTAEDPSPSDSTTCVPTSSDEDSEKLTLGVPTDGLPPTNE